jgi:hypothetical protein
VDLEMNPPSMASSNAFLSHICRRGNVSCPEKWAGGPPTFVVFMPAF